MGLYQWLIPRIKDNSLQRFPVYHDVHTVTRSRNGAELQRNSNTDTPLNSLLTQRQVCAFSSPPFALSLSISYFSLIHADNILCNHFTYYFKNLSTYQNEHTHKK